MQTTLDTINIALLTVIVLVFSLGLVVYMAGRNNKINKHFFIFTITASLWSLGMFLARSYAGTEYAPSFLRLLYMSASLIPFAFIFFIKFFPEEKFNIPLKWEIFLTIPLIPVLFITLLPNYLILSSSKPILGEQIIYFNKTFHLIYGLYIISYFSLCYSILFWKYKNFTGLEKQQIVYVIFGTLVSTMIGVSTNLVMPFFGNFSLNWLGQVGVIIMVSSISYSILKHKLFNLKVIATQFVVFILCLSLFIRTLLSTQSGDFVVNILYLIFSVIIGALLIKSVVAEVKQREKVEELAKNLEHTNQKLEKANDKLKELDNLKSEFLSLATHQIRAPLTAIKGYASLILEKDYGEISSPVEGAVKIIYSSCQNLVSIVGDFLDISRIEQGKMKYDVSDFNIIEVVKAMIDEQEPNIHSSGLYLNFTKESEELIVNADQNKIKEIIENILDNAIKYTKVGGIDVNIKSISKKVVVSFKDSGVGIDKSEISKLFNKFVRTKDANKTNVIGTGLGLYIAKQMIEAQKGKIWVESEGLGKGSTFFIELPLKK